MSYVCLQDECPLDEVDAKPQARVRFNILDLGGDVPTHTTFECGVTVTDILDKHAAKNPLAGTYWAVQMTGPKNNRRTAIRPVKARDLPEDWDTEALTKEEIQKFDKVLWDEDSLEVNSRSELQAVADAAAQ